MSVEAFLERMARRPAVTRRWTPPPIPAIVGPPVKRWRRIPGFPKYRVSCCGEILRVNGERLRTCISADGYEKVQLWRHGRHFTTQVARVVCLAFHGVPNPDELPHHGYQWEASHLNALRRDNCADNLAWEDKLKNNKRRRGSSRPKGYDKLYNG